VTAVAEQEAATVVSDSSLSRLCVNEEERKEGMSFHFSRVKREWNFGGNKRIIKFWKKSVQIHLSKCT
jgi:hypothetical protein